MIDQSIGSKPADCNVHLRRGSVFRVQIRVESGGQAAALKCKRGSVASGTIAGVGIEADILTVSRSRGVLQPGLHV